MIVKLLKSINKRIRRQQTKKRLNKIIKVAKERGFYAHQKGKEIWIYNYESESLIINTYVHPQDKSRRLFFYRNDEESEQTLKAILKDLSFSQAQAEIKSYDPKTGKSFQGMSLQDFLKS